VREHDVILHVNNRAFTPGGMHRQQALAPQAVRDPKLSAPVPSCPLQSTPVLANCWQRSATACSTVSGRRAVAAPTGLHVPR
jgi:hypothetical protein